MSIPHCRAVPTGTLPSLASSNDPPASPQESIASPAGSLLVDFAGAYTNSGSFDGVDGNLEVQTVTFPASPQLYAEWFMGSNGAGYDTQGGWLTERGNTCQGSGGPFVFTQDQIKKVYGAILCYGTYQLTAGYTDAFATELDYDGNWGDWLYWAGGWNLLHEVKMPFSSTPNVEAFGEAHYQSGTQGPQFGTIYNNSISVETASPFQWNSWTTAFQTTSFNQSPYCLYYPSPYNAMETWNTPQLHC